MIDTESTLKIGRMKYKARFTGNAIPVYSTMQMIPNTDTLGSSTPIRDGEYTAIHGEIFDVFAIEEKGVKYIGLRPQIDHDNYYLVLDTKDYLDYLERGVYDEIPQ